MGRLDDLVSRLFGSGTSTSNPAPQPAKRKKRILFTCSTLENTHGVPVVMNNIAQVLQSMPDYEVYFLITSFNDHDITLYRPDKTKRRWYNRQHFLEELDPCFETMDIVHMHSWHVADPFVYFFPRRHEAVGLETYLGSFPNARFIYTDHTNPSVTVETIEEETGVNIERLPYRDRVTFLEQTRLREGDPRFSTERWKEGWYQTEILCRQLLYRTVDRVTHVSNNQWHCNRRITPGIHDEQKHVTIYNGIDFTRYSFDPAIARRALELRRQHQIGTHEKVIYYCGRPVREKGFFDFLESLRLLHERSPDLPIRGVITATTEHIEGTTIEEYVEQHYPSLKGLIISTGRISSREELAAYHKLADIAVQPTHGECFNQGIGEALAMGTPAITTDCTGPKEVYVDRGLAYGVPVANPYALSLKIEEILRDYGTAKAAAERAQGYVREHLSVEAMAHQYMELYDGLIGERDRNSPTHTIICPELEQIVQFTTRLNMRRYETQRRITTSRQRATEIHEMESKAALFWANRTNLRSWRTQQAFTPYKTAIETYLMIGTREGNLAALYLIHEFLEQHHDISPFQRSTLLFYRGLGEQQEERRSEAGVSFRASLDSYPLPRNDIFTRTVQKYLHQLGE